MNIEILLKSVTAILGIFGVGKIIYEVSTGSKQRLREEYRFAKEFLEDTSKKPCLHPLVVEKGYYAIAGTTSIKSKEVEYLISLKNPYNSLKDYVLSRKYVEILYILDINANPIIDYRKKYKSDWSRRLRKAFYIITYFICAAIALSPFVFFQLSKFQIFDLVIIILVFGLTAIDQLRSFMKIVRGEQLVKNQKKHTK